MDYEELEKYKWKQYAITIKQDINFDDFSNVQQYLRVKRAANHAERRLSENVYEGGLNSILGVDDGNVD